MTFSRRSGLLTFALLGLLSSAPALAAQRFAIVVGNNAGQPFVPRLWFSVSDADRLTRTLEELGHFASEDVITLRDQDLAAIKGAFARVAQKVQANPAEPALLFFYYSGHADESGLEVGGEQLLYSDLKALMSASPARTKVAVIDACDSGSLTRVRRGQAAPLVKLGEEERAEGIVYISSTAIGEAAQESAALKGGFFTSHLDAALRGAADEDHDGRVSLSEAFRYSSAHTTADTMRTHEGPQHPTYTMNLAGRGEVILTDLHVAESLLVLPAATEATYLLHGPSGLLQEIPAADNAMEVALPSGHYLVERRHGEDLEATSVELAPHNTTALPRLTRTAMNWSQLRGGQLPIHVSLGGGLGPTVLGWGFLATGGVLAISRPLGPVDLRAQLTFNIASVTTTAGKYSLTSESIGGGAFWPVLYWHSFLIEVGPQLAVGRVDQSKPGFDTEGSMEMIGSATALATLWAGPLRWGPYFSVEGHFFKLDHKWTARPLTTGGISLGF